MITVNLTVGSKYPVDRAMIRARVTAFLESQSLRNVAINVSIVGERKITQLNEHYLHHEGVTDVLSFPQYEKGSSVDYESTLDPTPPENPAPPFIAPTDLPTHLGDIVVCFPEAVRQAMKRGKMVDDHICSLIEHGMHHLLGMHHE